MGQLAIYLKDQLENEVTRAAKRAGKSRSRWVAEAVRDRLRCESALPDSFFQTLGSWEDDRSAEEILEDIKTIGLKPQKRSVLR